jgi:hypothetical protein
MSLPPMKTCGTVPRPDTARTVENVMPLPSVTSSNTTPFSFSTCFARAQCGQPSRANTTAGSGAFSRGAM